MKQIKIISILIVALSFSNCQSQEKKKDLTSNENTTKIEVIDFHSTHRCVTCKAIEANTKYTLETYFSKELENGKITFQIVNVDEKENEKLAEKFEASGTSLFLNIKKDGTEKPIDLTEFAFMYGKDKVNFATKLRKTIKAELSNL